MSWPSRNLGCCFDPSKNPDKVAIIDLARPEQPQEMTYAALDAACDAVARGLRMMRGCANAGARAIHCL